MPGHSLIGDRVWHDLFAHKTHHDDPQPTTATTPGATTMDLTQFDHDMQADIEAIKANLEQFAARHLPAATQAADVAAKAAQSPLVRAALAAVLPPDVEQGLATTVATLDAALRAEQAQAQATQPAPDAEPPADAPAA